MHPRLLRAWVRLKALAKEVGLHIELGRRSLMPLPEAVSVAIRYLPLEDRRERAIPNLARLDVSEEDYVANAIAMQFPVWGRVNSWGNPVRIPFGMSSGLFATVKDGGYTLGFTTKYYGWFDDLHIQRSHVLEWVKWARMPWPRPTERSELHNRWALDTDQDFAGPPMNPDKSFFERQGRETDFDDSEVMALLERKLDEMDKTPVKTDVGKPRKRRRKRLTRGGR